MKRLRVSPLLLAVAALLAPAMARADVALFLEEPYGHFGGMNPTGHASVYLSRVCAETPTTLRRCKPGEQGVVLSRYHRVAGYDWIAIPLIPYLYAVNRPEEVPWSVDREQVASLRDNYRRKYLEELAPDGPDGTMPKGDWTQLVGASYDRMICSFELDTTAEQDDQLIEAFNDRKNKTHFNLFFHNCADFSRQVIDFYYPKAVRRDFIADAGIMTPKQAAKCMVRYAKRHPDLQSSEFAIAQVQGSVPRSGAVRGVFESLVKSKRYILTLAPLMVFQPYVGGGLAFAWVGEGRFNARKIAGNPEPTLDPSLVPLELQANQVLFGAVNSLR